MFPCTNCLIFPICKNQLKDYLRHSTLSDKNLHFQKFYVYNLLCRKCSNIENFIVETNVDNNGKIIRTINTVKLFLVLEEFGV